MNPDRRVKGWRLWMWCLAMTLFASFFALGCFGARAQLRSFYVIFGAPKDPMKEVVFLGMLRVQDLDADSIYEKFQIVMRRSPYELHYSEPHVWAVKPSQMVSDIIAKTLVDTRTFSQGTRTLGDYRPKYTMAGELHAIEIYESDDLWFAHLAFSLRMSEFETGKRLYSFRFDERKLVPEGNFAHAVRALSELLDGAMDRVVAELTVLGLSRSDVDDLRLDSQDSTDRSPGRPVPVQAMESDAPIESGPAAEPGPATERAPPGDAGGSDPFFVPADPGGGE